MITKEEISSLGFFELMTDPTGCYTHFGMEGYFGWARRLTDITDLYHNFSLRSYPEAPNTEAVQVQTKEELNLALRENTYYEDIKKIREMASTDNSQWNYNNSSFQYPGS